MKEEKPQVWKSGDWKEENNEKPPYNGIEISATPAYAATGKQKDFLTSVTITITDHTLSTKNDVKSTFKIADFNKWNEIPIPNKVSAGTVETENKEEAPIAAAKADKRFTVRGLSDNTLGLMMLAKQSSEIYLNIQFTFGGFTGRREEIGYILAFPEKQKERKEPTADSYSNYEEIESAPAPKKEKANEEKQSVKGKSKV